MTTVSRGLPFNNSAETSDIRPDINWTLSFNRGEDQYTSVSPAVLMVSDPFEFDFTGISTYISNKTTEAGSILSVSMYLAQGQNANDIMLYPRSRTKALLVNGIQIDATNATGPSSQSLTQ